VLNLAGLGRVGRFLFLVALLTQVRATSGPLAARPVEGTALTAGARDCLITMPGDVNNDGFLTTGDIIYLVDFYFKGGMPPRPCIAAGDVNCSGSVTSADIIWLVNYVIKLGMPPCDICNRSPLAPSCN
jgi:hypothetical protein